MPGLESRYRVIAEGFLRDEPERVLIAGVAGDTVKHTLMVPGCSPGDEFLVTATGLPDVQVPPIIKAEAAEGADGDVATCRLPLTVCSANVQQRTTGLIYLQGAVSLTILLHVPP